MLPDLPPIVTTLEAMRLAVVVWVCGLAACDARSGTYFVVDGDQAGITFDQLEFFLGKDGGGTTPYTPGNPFNPAVTPAATERQRLTKRVFSDSDVQTTPETTSLTYLLPPEFAPSDTSYALIVASRGGVRVGIAEVESYHVFDDAAYVYEIALGPIDAGFERWGVPMSPAADCVRWTRQREGDAAPSTYAVVRSDDHDCDGSRSSADCDDLNFCADPAPGNACSRRVTGCISGTCDIGICVDGTPLTSDKKTCEPKVCLPDAFCSDGDACRETDAPLEFLACAINLPLSHTEVTMPVRGVNGGLCTHTFEVPPPASLGCNSPMIEWPPLGNAGTWRVTVAKSMLDPSICTFDLLEPTLEAPPPAQTHVVVSVDGLLAPFRRTSFVVGFAPRTTPPLDCATADVEVTQPSGSTAPTCP